MNHAGVCAWIGLVETAKIQSGQNILVHAGAGAIGGMAVQIARHVGCQVTATCSAANADYVRGLGADRIVAYDREDFTTSVSGQDVVFDLVGGDVHKRSCRVLKKGGTIVWLIATPFENVSEQYGVICKQAMIHDRRETLEKVADAVGSGILIPQVSRTMPIGEVAQAHQILERGDNSRGRIILEIGE